MDTITQADIIFSDISDSISTSNNFINYTFENLIFMHFPSSNSSHFIYLILNPSPRWRRTFRHFPIARFSEIHKSTNILKFSPMKNNMINQNILTPDPLFSKRRVVLADYLAIENQN
jgi:hypothetical protein